MMKRRNQKVSLDIVIPVFNEEQVLSMLFDRLTKTFSEESKQRYGLKEVKYIFVDDGSSDRSKLMIVEQIKSGMNAELIIFSRNFGHQAAVSAGLDQGTGDLTAFIDADLQDPPEVILQMVDKWREGNDIIYGTRRKRKEHKIKVFCYWLFYRILDFMAEVEIAKDSGDFCLLDRQAADAIRQLPEKIRFPRGLRAWVGFKQIGLEYERDSRAAGDSKYSFRKLLRLAATGIFSLSIRPLRFVQIFCGLYLLIMMLFTFVALYRYYFYPTDDTIPLYHIFGYALTSFTSFMLMFALYIQGSYIGRVYLEIKGRPTYIIQELVQNHGN